MSQSLLKAEHIKISFGNVHALRDVSLEILPGEIHCLAGENGCGKSTIIKIIFTICGHTGYHDFIKSSRPFHNTYLFLINP